MKKYQKLVLTGAALLPMIYGSAVFAAKPINLSHQNISILQSIISASPAQTALANKGIGLKEISHSVGFNQTLHTRFQQTYRGYPVWGGDFIVHVPNGGKAANSLKSMLAKNNTSMNGTLYQDLNIDLASAPSVVFSQTQSQKALQLAIDTHQHTVGLKSAIKDTQSQLVVFMDQSNKAHWAFHVGFYVEAAKTGMLPAKPNFLIDAVSLKVYQQWDDIQTLEDIEGGGFGGNIKMGKMVYDGLADHLPTLSFHRDVSPEEGTASCLLQNADVTVKSYQTRNVENFDCNTKDPEHNLFWNGEKDAVNDGYSPDNDALFGGAVIKSMYEKWYGVPVLTKNGKPMMLNMVVHDPIDNAYWDGRQMTFGDGVRMFYPLTSLGVAAHEISHGFTEQHAGLVYRGQSGGMNEAFSDMAAQAAEVFAYGKNSWQIGPEIFKAENEALRYMDKPSKDCKGREPGNWCSIDHVSQYRAGLDVHYSSGIYNRAYYLLGTTEGWSPRKAFEVMVQANMHYWTASSTFAQGACGVLSAAKDLGYDLAAVTNAFETVGVETGDCTVIS